MSDPVDRTVVTDEIQSLTQNITRLETKKSILLGQLEKLDVELNALQNQRAKLESRIAAIWTLPNEILAYIFELGASEQEAAGEHIEASKNDDDSNDTGIQDIQILVSHVSRHFRNVALNTPVLWSSIHVLDLKPPRLDYISTCLQRSGSLPVSISLDCEDDDSEYKATELPTTPVEDAMGRIKPNMYRLKRFMARFRSFDALHRVMLYLDQPAPQLEALELSEVDFERTFDAETLFSPGYLSEPLTLFQGNIPKLTSVMLDGVHVSWSQCNFKNLVVLCLGYHTADVRPTYEEFRTIIQNSPSLRELSLQGSSPIFSEDVSMSSLYEPFPLESLEELRVSDVSSDYASLLISLLRAPNLKSLILSELDTNDYSSLLDHISGPPVLYPNLISLKLVCIEASDMAATRLLRAYPKLEWLGLYAIHGCPQWVALLESAGEHLCPALKCLRCVKIDLEDIKDVFSKRKEANIPLPKLELDRREEDFMSQYP
ncbi:hypothetical protein Clacol_007720 [Clathrus columnatus]|uniref:F-box domain-containing protein n=1 Tax=Clathrus columnatus TaxID=1419009 RepID=A0AAV5AKJ3_9AGAM|nr:hypothetical protein Clacol_007720 [Clathrus columnatus]